jgi:hypothetical protein
MNLKAITKIPKQYLVLGAVGIVSVLLLTTLLIKLSMMSVDEAQAELMDLTSKIERADRSLSGSEKTIQLYTDSVRALKEYVSDIPPARNQYSWATEIIYSVARRTFVEIDAIDEVRRSGGALSKGANEIKLESYKLRIIAHCGYRNLKTFVRRMNEGHPMVRITGLEIGKGSKADRHDIQMFVEWPFVYGIDAEKLAAMELESDQIEPQGAVNAEPSGEEEEPDTAEVEPEPVKKTPVPPEPRPETVRTTLVKPLPAPPETTPEPMVEAEVPATPLESTKPVAKEKTQAAKLDIEPIPVVQAVPAAEESKLPEAGGTLQEHPVEPAPAVVDKEYTETSHEEFVGPVVPQGTEENSRPDLSEAVLEVPALFKMESVLPSVTMPDPLETAINLPDETHENMSSATSQDDQYTPGSVDQIDQPTPAETSPDLAAASTTNQLDEPPSVSAGQSSEASILSDLEALLNEAGRGASFTNVDDLELEEILDQSPKSESTDSLESLLEGMTGGSQ